MSILSHFNCLFNRVVMKSVNHCVRFILCKSLVSKWLTSQNSFKTADTIYKKYMYNLQFIAIS